MIDISIVVPVYNVEKFLPKCLDSLIVQDECVKEIILINDGSTDNSLQICQDYALKDKRIKIIIQENKGLSATVRVGVKAATCDYIGFVDSDDFVEPDMFKLMADKMEQSGADVVFCDYDTVAENGKKLTTKNLYIDLKENVFAKENGTFSVQILPTLKDGRFIPGFRVNKLFKRDSIINNISFDNLGVIHGEDIALTVPIMFASEKIACVHKSLYHYFQRSTSIVHSYNRNNLRDWALIMDIIDRARREYNYKIEKFDDVSLALLLSLCLFKIRISTLSRKRKKDEYKFIGTDKQVRQLLSTVKIKTNFKHKIVFKLLKYRMYGLLSLIY